MDITNARTLLVATIATMTTPQIEEAVKTLSADTLTTESRMVRAEMIEEFIRRNGMVAGDALMDAVGL